MGQLILHVPGNFVVDEKPSPLFCVLLMPFLEHCYQPLLSSTFYLLLSLSIFVCVSLKIRWYFNRLIQLFHEFLHKNADFLSIFTSLCFWELGNLCKLHIYPTSSKSSGENQLNHKQFSVNRIVTSNIWSSIFWIFFYFYLFLFHWL